jgi:hypothetical protein
MLHIFYLSTAPYARKIRLSYVTDHCSGQGCLFVQFS